jgi:pyruvate/2-oxoglutarate/acetoin dehydrogenase E1 component
MTKFSKTLLLAAGLAAIATSAISQTPWEMKSGMAYMYTGPGKMSAMAMASTPKNHDAMMKNAQKVPNNTVFFMEKGQLYSTSGMLDPTGNFYLP